MLYLRNTNQLQTLQSDIVRGISSPVPPPPPPPTSSVIPTGNGLYRTQYNGYFDGVPSWFDTAVSSSLGMPNTGSISPGFTSSINSSSVQWLGYFTPTVTEAYTFYALTDDAMWMWIGNDASSSYTTSSANIGTTSRGPLPLTGSAIELISGTFYPMRIQFGEADGIEYLTMSYQTATISKTENWSSNIYYNTSSNGF
jgi:hypothetical protein